MASTLPNQRPLMPHISESGSGAVPCQSFPFPPIYRHPCQWIASPDHQLADRPRSPPTSSPPSNHHPRLTLCTVWPAHFPTCPTIRPLRPGQCCFEPQPPPVLTGSLSPERNKPIRSRESCSPRVCQPFPIVQLFVFLALNKLLPNLCMVIFWVKFGHSPGLGTSLVRKVLPIHLFRE